MVHMSNHMVYYLKGFKKKLKPMIGTHSAVDVELAGKIFWLYRELNGKTDGGRRCNKVL